MVAAGNDFIVIDNIAGAKGRGPGSDLEGFARMICDRKYGVGADGLIILERSKKADFKMRIFNPDGSEPRMCGNGARCAALFYESHTTKRKPRGVMKFETKAGQIDAQVKKEIVKLKMPDPKDVWPKIDLNIGTQFYKVHYINTGVPHAVFFVGNVDTKFADVFEDRLLLIERFHRLLLHFYSMLCGGIRGNIRTRTRRTWHL